MPEVGSYWIGGYYNTVFKVVHVDENMIHYQRYGIDLSPTYAIYVGSFIRMYRPATKLERYLNGWI
jgi:hypothetical protein